MGPHRARDGEGHAAARRASRNGSRRSPSWSRRRSPAARAASSSPGSPTSRPRCGAWRPSSPGGAPPDEVFDAVAEELGRLLDVASSGLVRFEDDDTATGRRRLGPARRGRPVGARLPIGGRNVVTEIARTGKPARIDDYERTGSGAIADRARRLNTGTAIGGPIVVAGRLWGAMIAATARRRLAAAGHRAAARAVRRARRHRDRQHRGARRARPPRRRAGRAAARGDARGRGGRRSPSSSRRSARRSAGVLGPAIESAILRYEGDETATVLAGSSDAGAGRHRRRRAAGARRRQRHRAGVPRAARGARGRLRDRGRRIADHAAKHEITTAIGCPILVKGRLWGSMVVAHREREPFPADTERRVMQFTELVATAIANAEARAELQRLADEQAALRRVATLVAEAAAPDRGLRRRDREVAQLLGASQVGMVRCRERGRGASSSPTARRTRGILHVGMRLPLAGDSVTPASCAPARSARINLDEEGDGADRRARPPRARQRHTVAAPLTVEGRALGRDHRQLGGATTRRPATPRSAWRSSRSCSAPRSPTPTAAISSRPRAPAC